MSKSFLHWAGGKGRLFHQIYNYMPQHFTTYTKGEDIIMSSPLHYSNLIIIFYFYIQNRIHYK